jgi:hypothetical protein
MTMLFGNRPASHRRPTNSSAAVEVEEVKEAKDKSLRPRSCWDDISVRLLPFPLPISLFSIPGRTVLPIQLTSVVATMIAFLTLAPNLAAQTGQPSATPGLSHDLSGVWMQYPDGDVPGVPGMNAVSNRTRPALTPWGQAKFDAAKPLVGPRAVPGVENNPELRCEPDGPPKLLNLPNPFEIVQIPGRVLMFFELGHIWREIWTDGRPLPKDPDPSYLGYSVGKWDGDTFVVDTTGFNDKLWDDSYGNPRSDATHLTERYRRLNHDTLELQIIIDDPKAYTKTWISPPKLHKLEPGWEIAEWFCVLDEDKAYDDAVRKPAGIAPAK